MSDIVSAMQLTDATGRRLDANYSVTPQGTGLALVLDSRGGGGTRDGRPGRNADYNQALELLLQRLGLLGATLLNAVVDSGRTRRLAVPEQDRQLIPAPVRLEEVRDVRELRLQMGRIQQRVAQEPGVPKGGNATKRICMLLEVPGYGPDQADLLAHDLSLPAPERGAPQSVLTRLDAADEQRPTDDDFAAAIAALDALDRTGQRAQRVEQSYLRRAIFHGPTARCDLCGREFETEFLVAAHIKKRADCTDAERRDVPNVVMAACRFGCDELFERGYLTVGASGGLTVSLLASCSQPLRDYAREHLAGKVFGQPMAGREEYFAWHRDHANPRPTVPPGSVPDPIQPHRADLAADNGHVKEGWAGVRA
jgi:hypothetical protein